MPRKRAQDKGPAAAAAADAAAAAADEPSERSDLTDDVPKPKKKRGGWTLGGVMTNLVTLAMVGYSGLIGKNFYRIYYPYFPDVDEASGRPIRKYSNIIKPGTLLKAQIYVTDIGIEPRHGTNADWEFVFPYNWDQFDSQVRPQTRRLCFCAWRSPAAWRQAPAANTSQPASQPPPALPFWSVPRADVACRLAKPTNQQTTNRSNRCRSRCRTGCWPRWTTSTCTPTSGRRRRPASSRHRRSSEPSG
eukprot:SAG22_NODE_1557_length_4130_cov_12.560159_4_plen_247_part_00